jgi:dimethylhistidine N-methyltransferase
MEVKTEVTYHEKITEEIIEGLIETPKRLPTKLFYDERGSKLFDQICELDEYYPTRTELKIIEDNIDDIVNSIGEESLLLELGSGSSLKTRLLLDYLPNLSAYVPVDISSDHLVKTAETLKSDYPGLPIYPLVADYTKPFTLPEIFKSYKTVDAFYPGSSIGNFTPVKARKFLERIAETCGSGSGLLIGVDLKKDETILNSAYNDKKGITTQFNMNILNHINNLTDSDFDLNKFSHLAFYNESASRIEMHLVSCENQQVCINGEKVFIDKNEQILTEYSYKYSLEDFEDLVKDIYKIENVWTDKNNLFSVQFFRSL